MSTIRFISQIRNSLRSISFFFAFSGKRSLLRLSLENGVYLGFLWKTEFISAFSGKRSLLGLSLENRVYFGFLWKTEFTSAASKFLHLQFKKAVLLEKHRKRIAVSVRLFDLIRQSILSRCGGSVEVTGTTHCPWRFGNCRSA